MSYRREMRNLIRDYQARGWVIERTNSGHVRWRSPTGEMIIDASSSSDHRARKNHIARLKRCADPLHKRYA